MGYYVRALKHKKSLPNWKLQYVSCKKADRKASSTAKNPKTTWDISKDRWRSLGFHSLMPIEDAKTRAKQLNSQLELKRQEEQLRNIEEEKQSLQLKYSSVLPASFVLEFEKVFVNRRILPNRPNKRTKTQRHVEWSTAQKMIVAIGIEPSEWFYSTDLIYDYFYKQALSVNYVKAIIRMANLWGFFISRKLSRPFLPIPNPKGYEKQRLAEAYYNFGKNTTKPAKGLSPEELNAAKNKLSVENYNWLYLSVWLGLRPKEIDSLHDQEMWRVSKSKNGIPVLSIFQTKIITVPHEDRWKPFK